MRRDYQLLAEKGIVGAYVQQTESRTAPWGAIAGQDGAKASSTLNPGTPEERHLKSKTIAYPMRRGEVLRLESSGGGGWGDPADRHPAAVAHDRREGYV